MTGLNGWAAANIALLMTLLLAGAVAALGLALWAALRLRAVERHYKILTAGTSGGDLRTVLEAHAESVRTTGVRVAEVHGLARDIERGARQHLQRVGFLRFNPFRDAGGDQSFALALADREGNGVVISSLHARDGTRVYGKPLVTWGSVYPLTDEERQAIEKARGAATTER